MLCKCVSKVLLQYQSEILFRTYVPITSAFMACSNFISARSRSKPLKDTFQMRGGLPLRNSVRNQFDGGEGSLKDVNFIAL